MDGPYTVDLQVECEDDLPVSESDIYEWISETLKAHQPFAELTLRFVEPDEIKSLNTTYRNKSKPTNVLAFPSDLPDYIQLDSPFLGDIIVCPKVLKEESVKDAIPLKAHFAHIIIHGVLHLLGYDHIKESDAKKMQSIEITLLATWGFENPYENEERL